MHLWKMISTFYKSHPEKPTITSIPSDFDPPITKLIVKLFAKWKQEYLAKNITKRAQE